MSDIIPFGKNYMSWPNDFFSAFPRDIFNEDRFSVLNSLNGNFRVDLKETDNEYLVEADLPGVKKDAINIEYDNNYLTISARREESVEDKNGNYVRRERYCGELKRSFFIKNVDEEKIDASFNGGVLKIVLPKLNKNLKGKRKIKIQ